MMTWMVYGRHSATHTNQWHESSMTLFRRTSDGVAVSTVSEV